ncbi:MAG: HDOD domain-containing protein, partial [Deltaproteobacteria bacterium]|nr:HDOD domain-containing protein [Deltaproteobacteria bacterium]
MGITEKASALLKKFNNIKTLPHVAIRLSRLISDKDSNIKEFEEVISLDPALVLRILKLVNSSYYGLQEKLDNISRAIVFIGLKNLRNLVVIEALKDIFKGKSSNGVFSRKQLWFHCAAASVLNRMISERIFGEKGEDAFLCGLLHDIGMMVEVQVAEDLFLKTCRAFQSHSKPFIEYEREIIGTDHPTVGYKLSRDWNLPENIQIGIQQHHQVIEDVSPKSIAGTLQMSEFFLAKLDYCALPGMAASLSPTLSKFIQENISEFKILMRDFP